MICLFIHWPTLLTKELLTMSVTAAGSTNWCSESGVIAERRHDWRRRTVSCHRCCCYCCCWGSGGNTVACRAASEIWTWQGQYIARSAIRWTKYACSLWYAHTHMQWHMVHTLGAGHFSVQSFQAYSISSRSSSNRFNRDQQNTVFICEQLIHRHYEPWYVSLHTGMCDLLNSLFPLDSVCRVAGFCMLALSSRAAGPTPVDSLPLTAVYNVVSSVSLWPSYFVHDTKHWSTEAYYS